MTEISIGFKDMIDQANQGIEPISITDAIALHADKNIVFIDLHDIRELKREGFIPNAFHCPRRMLEFWIHPDSPYCFMASGDKVSAAPRGRDFDIKSSPNVISVS